MYFIENNNYYYFPIQRILKIIIIDVKFYLDIGKIRVGKKGNWLQSHSYFAFAFYFFKSHFFFFQVSFFFSPLSHFNLLNFHVVFFFSKKF